MHAISIIAHIPSPKKLLFHWTKNYEWHVAIPPAFLLSPLFRSIFGRVCVCVCVSELIRIPYRAPCVSIGREAKRAHKMLLAALPLTNPICTLPHSLSLSPFLSIAVSFFPIFQPELATIAVWPRSPTTPPARGCLGLMKKSPGALPYAAVTAKRTKPIR